MRNSTVLTKALFAKGGQPFEEVTLPHTWNALDGQDGGADYHRGICTYEIRLPDPAANKRQYIEFQAANHIATVWCNGQMLGTHKGGFSTFRFELTQVMQPTENVLKVEVTNEICDIYPQRADFTFHGGLYRDVTFIEVENAHFDLLKNGSQGVFITPRNGGHTRIDAFPVNAQDCQINVKLLDAEGNQVGFVSAAAEDHTTLSAEVSSPHLWHSILDPYCYTAVAELEMDGILLDQVTVTYGYRSFHVDPNTGFYLNGKSFPLHGVCRHQDRQDKGWAISPQDHEEDARIIKEVGANTIRLGHYQHAQHFYDICDKTGFVLWTEIPFISKFIPGKEAYENTISQMTELIAQNYNHPSVFFWGIANEITIGGYSEEQYRNLCDLNALCKRMDPSRMTTIAQLGSVPHDSDHVYITDLQSYNYYFGWYSSELEENNRRMDKFHADNPDRPYGVSEYGADNLVRWHSAEPVNHDYTEEYACQYHHHMLKAFAERPYLWATHVWIMFDYASDIRDEGGEKGTNFKGLVTRDRKTYKDCFYIYKAYWTDAPMVHICGRRFTDRAPHERDVTVYTNRPQVTLLVNGKEYMTLDVVDHAAVFPSIPLESGENTLTARCDGATDSITLNGVPQHNNAYDLPDIAEAKQIGNWFADLDDDDSEEIIISEGVYTIEDPCSVLLSDPDCLRMVKGWIMNSQYLTDTEKLTSISRLTNWCTMWGDRKFFDIKLFSKLPLKEKAKLNRKLSGVFK